MSDNQNAVANLSNQWYELANEIYRTYIKTLVVGQERALELTKTLVSQATSYQSEGRTLVEEYAGQLQRAQQLLQGIVQGSIKSSTELVSQYRETTNANLADLNKRLEELEDRLKKASQVG